MNITGMKINRKTQHYGTLSDATKSEINEKWANGQSMQEIADSLEISRVAISNHIQRNK